MTEVATKPTKEAAEDEKEYDDLKELMVNITDKMAKIQKRFGDEVSNIPQSSEFWSLRDQLMRLTDQKLYADQAKLRGIQAETAKKKSEIELKAKQEEAKVDAEAAKEVAKVVSLSDLKAKKEEPAKK